MKNYMIMFHTDHPIPEGGNEAFGKWFESISEHIVDGGNPFNPESQAQIKDGKVTMDADSLAGYTVVKANSLEDAVTWSMTNPMANMPGCEVRVYETMPM